MKSMLIKSPQTGYLIEKTYPPYTPEKVKFSKRMIKICNMSQKTMSTILLLFTLFFILVILLSVGWVQLNKHTFTTAWDGLTLVFDALKAAFGYGKMVCTSSGSD